METITQTTNYFKYIVIDQADMFNDFPYEIKGIDENGEEFVTYQSAQNKLQAAKLLRKSDRIISVTAL